MIGQIPDPSQTGSASEAKRLLYVPLATRKAVYRPIAPPLGARTEWSDAARVCADSLRMAYLDIFDRTRMVRGLCEHSDVEFDGEVVDADLLRTVVSGLFKAVSASWPNIESLLEAPGPDDLIRIKGKRMRSNEDGVLIVDDQASSEPGPLLIRDPDDATEATDDETAAWIDAPGKAMVSMLRAVIEQVEQQTGNLIDVAEYDQAIEFLQQMRAERHKLAVEAES